VKIPFVRILLEQCTERQLYLACYGKAQDAMTECEAVVLGMPQEGIKYYDHETERYLDYLHERSL
jgi:hypothetical protein